MSKVKVTWNDIHEGKAKDLMNHYKLNERQLQQQLHKHLDGANHQDKQKMYRTLYDKKGY